MEEALAQILNGVTTPLTEQLTAHEKGAYHA
jgi:hypothetical protein